MTEPALPADGQSGWRPWAQWIRDQAAKVAAAATAATASTLVSRDGNGRAQVADGSAAADISTKGQMDTAITGAKARANHTGTQSLDTTTDSATRLAMTSAERTKLGSAVAPTRQVISGTGLAGGGDLSADRTLTVAYGTAAGTAVQGNDTRVTADQAAGTASTRTLGTGAQQAAAGNHSHTLAALGAAPSTIAANTQTGTAYTLVAADATKAVEMNNAAANTVTVPASVFTAGQVVELFALGAGITTVTAGAGLTLRAPDGARLAKQYASATLRFRSATEAVLAGNTIV